MKKKKLTIQGLIAPEFTPIIDGQLASFQHREDIDQKKLREWFASREKVNHFYGILEDQITNLYLNGITIEDFRLRHSVAKENSQRIVDLHEDMFQFYFAYVHTSQNIYLNFLRHMITVGPKASELETKDLINLVLYGNICRMADQIGVQMMHGFPDSAVILWRTFYEYCVVAVFLLVKDSNELATRFRDYSQKETVRRTESFMKRHEDLKFPPLSDEYIAEARKHYEKLEQGYGQEFFKNEYAWAGPFLKTKPSFMAIEEAAFFSRLRPFYIWASSKIHPTYLGITDFRNSNNATVLDNIINVETARLHFVNPAELTIHAFQDVNAHFLNRYSGHEYIINMTLLKKISDKLGETFMDEKSRANERGQKK